MSYLGHLLSDPAFWAAVLPNLVANLIAGIGISVPFALIVRWMRRHKARTVVSAGHYSIDGESAVEFNLQNTGPGSFGVKNIYWNLLTESEAPLRNYNSDASPRGFILPPTTVQMIAGRWFNQYGTLMDAPLYPRGLAMILRTTLPPGRYVFYWYLTTAHGRFPASLPDKITDPDKQLGRLDLDIKPMK